MANGLLVWSHRAEASKTRYLPVMIGAGIVGSIIGNPIVPVLKLTANPKTVRTMSEHIDLDVSPLITADMTLDQAADAPEDIVVSTASGRWCAAEILGHKEFVLTRLHRTA